MQQRNSQSDIHLLDKNKHFGEEPFIFLGIVHWTPLQKSYSKSVIIYSSIHKKNEMVTKWFIKKHYSHNYMELNGYFLCYIVKDKKIIGNYILDIGFIKI